jgi:hypothetical protein
VLASPYSLRLQNDIDLAHNTHLRHLRLTIYCHEPVEWAFTLLSQITSPVEHVSLVIFNFNLGGVDWARVDRLLTQPRWANLRRLSVQSICDMPPMEFIRSRLPILESRGVVLDLVV